MFGNRVGWAISVLILLGAISALWAMQRSVGQVLAPTFVGQRAGRYTLALPTDPRSAVALASNSENAIALYRQAIAEFDANRLLYGRYLDGGKLDENELRVVEPGLGMLIEAAQRPAPGVFADRPAELVTYDSDRPALKSLKRLADVAFRVARQRQIAGEKEKARQLYEAIFILGIKLYEERLVYEEMEKGAELMRVGRYLAELTADSARAERLRSLEAQWRGFYGGEIEPVQQAVFVVYPHTADMLALARHAREPMWRVEATLQLGRCRFTSGTRAERAAVAKALEVLGRDGDPRVRLAAGLASSLTVEQFRIIR